MTMQARRLARTVGSPPLARLVGEAFSPEALAALAPAASAVPGALWARALAQPVTEVLGRPGKEFRGRLTAAAFRLAGGDGAPPAALGAMLEIIHAGSMVVDDIEDDSPVRRGGPALHRVFGVPLALNAGNWMYFFPFELVAALSLPAADELGLRRRMTRTMLDCHYGQALDLAAHVGEVAQERIGSVARTISTLKTGRLMGLAAAAGATTAAGAPRVVEALATFGEHLGIALQMLDDLGDLAGAGAPEKRFEDLRRGRVTWPWAWAAALLDERAWAALETQGRRVARGAEAAEALAAKLRALVSARGRLETRWWLDRALGDLRESVGASPLVEGLEAELTRLEASYG